MSDKALNRVTLELTQRIQTHFPRGISSTILHAWNSAPTEVLSARLREVFGKLPQYLKQYDVFATFLKTQIALVTETEIRTQVGSCETRVRAENFEDAVAATGAIIPRILNGTIVDFTICHIRLQHASRYPVHHWEVGFDGTILKDYEMDEP